MAGTLHAAMELNVFQIDDLQELVAHRGSLRGAVLQGIDLRGEQIDWSVLEIDDSTTFLGCRFASVDEELAMRARGALVFPRLGNLPYDPYRSSLYTWRELLDEPSGSEPGVSRDLLIYRHFQQQGRHLPDIREALAQRLHDHAMDDALNEFLDWNQRHLPRKRAVGLMGGHSAERGSEVYRHAAQVGHALARAGFLVTTGGGPGVMEAGNLGAYLAEEDFDAVDAAIDQLARSARYVESGYVERAREVVEQYPRGRESLAIPTWFYGHEPTNLFATAIAKYFSNSLREDGLLAICLYGVVYAPGSAGTAQEIFQDLAQNYYVTFGYRSAMVLLGGEQRLYEAARWLTERGGFPELFLRTECAESAVSFIIDHPPRPLQEQ